MPSVLVLLDALGMLDDERMTGCKAAKESQNGAIPGAAALLRSSGGHIDILRSPGYGRGQECAFVTENMMSARLGFDFFRGCFWPS